MNSVIARAIPLSLLLASALQAQVPQLINYQGRVAVGAVNFNGSGQFKFALVNGDGTESYWSNDGTSAAGSEPTAAVSLTVTNGLYSVLLGDTSLANMMPIPPSVFANGDVHLRVWFDDGVNGSQLLTPDQRIAAVGYAIMAGGVPDGAITGAQLAPGAAAANLSVDGQAGVASGGLVLSATSENVALLNAGYVRIGVAATADAWVERASATPLAGRHGHTAVWTGSEMIVWGGFGGSSLNTGGRYDPTANSWSAVTTSGAPVARNAHTAVWTGSEMIVWGG
jgi:hypothetical protein